MNVLTGRAVPRPERAVGPVNFHAGLAVAALLELLVEMYDVLSAHPSRDTASEFKYVLWGAVSRPLSHCTFQSPLASFTNRTGLRAQDLIQAFDHFDRCSHSDHPNTGASRNRAEFTVELLAAKVDYQTAPHPSSLRHGAPPRPVVLPGRKEGRRQLGELQL